MCCVRSARRARLLLQSLVLFAGVIAGSRILRSADLQDVISALRNQDYRSALTLAKELSAQDASDPRIWTLQGMANEGLKNKVEALRDYKSALKLKPDYLPALKAEAQLEYADGDAGAARTLERIVKIEPADQTSHAMLAALAYKQGNCSSAVAQYRQCSDVISVKPDALTQYGECLLKENQPDQAIIALTQVIALEPHRWWPRYNLASAQLSRKKAGEALEILQPLLNAPPVQSEVLDLAGEAYEASGDTPHGVELLRKAILAQPQNETYYLHFTDLCFDHSSFQVGIDMIDAGLTQLPRSAKLYLARGILWGQLGDFAKAESDFDHADRLDPNGVISGAATSLAELQNSNLKQALQLARRKLVTSPDDPMLNYVKAETLRQMGVGPDTAEFREALESASVAVRLKPGFAAARNLLGSLYMQESKLQLAAELFRAVLKEDPADQTAIYRLIQISRKTGRSGEIPGLMKQLAQARTTQRESDQAARRYRLVEAPTGH